MIYGEGEGFGNRTSIQDVTIAQAAKALRQVYKVDNDDPVCHSFVFWNGSEANKGQVWPVCHVVDTTNLYLQIPRRILAGPDIGYGRRGFYLAGSGSMRWNDVYKAFAEALAKRGVVDNAQVEQADDTALARIGRSWEYLLVLCRCSLVGSKSCLGPLYCSSRRTNVLTHARCTFTAVHGNEIGWEAEYPPEHILEAADAKVDLILKTLDSRESRETIR
jgi:hypothetical protein